MKKNSVKTRLRKKWMGRAIQSASSGMKRLEGGPFGACIVRKGKVLAVAHNTVLKTKDPTCHAEINAIRIASRKLRNFDLSDCAIYSTTEPCPMCFSAIHWARIAVLYYGTGIEDVATLGFNELSLSNRKMKKTGKSPVKIHEKFMVKECRELLLNWTRQKVKIIY